MPPACPQIKDTTYPFFQYVPETLPLGSFSEDCLTLNICTPSNATASSNLPVIIWIYGGAFVQGSLDTPAWNPAPWC
ncbi:Carboxylesterase 1D [Colletotrichum fructicola]|nr:Carboxylesterase 1D [Colletotrichum fructicola]KAF4889054.1 Carboxylesterase 1D [Colletotrichum fructicola]